MASIDYNSPIYRRSRVAYFSASALEHIIFLLVDGAFLAKLFSHFGASEGLTGVISSVSSIAMLSELISVIIASRNISSKKYTIITKTISSLLFASVYLLPVIDISNGTKAYLAGALVFIGFFSRNLPNSIYFIWANSLTNPVKKSAYQAINQMISLVCGIVISLASAYLIDSFEAQKNLDGGFLLIFISVMVFLVLDFISFALIKKEDQPEAPPKRKALSETIKLVFGSPICRDSLISVSLMNVGMYLTVGFIGTYQINALSFSVTQTQLILNFATIIRIALSLPIGRFSDKHSNANGFALGIALLFFSSVASAVSSPGFRYMIVVYFILYQLSLSSTEINSFFLFYQILDHEELTNALIFKSCISGIFGFLASLAGGFILNAVQNNGNRILGISLYPQQFLSVCSCVVLIITFVFYKIRVLNKLKA